MYEWNYALWGGVVGRDAGFANSVEQALRMITASVHRSFPKEPSPRINAPRTIETGDRVYDISGGKVYLGAASIEPVNTRYLVDLSQSLSGKRVVAQANPRARNNAVSYQIEVTPTYGRVVGAIYTLTPGSGQAFTLRKDKNTLSMAYAIDKEYLPSTLSFQSPDDALEQAIAVDEEHLRGVKQAMSGGFYENHGRIPTGDAAALALQGALSELYEDLALLMSTWSSSLGMFPRGVKLKTIEMLRPGAAAYRNPTHRLPPFKAPPFSLSQYAIIKVLAGGKRIPGMLYYDDPDAPLRALCTWVYLHIKPQFPLRLGKHDAYEAELFGSPGNAYWARRVDGPDIQILYAVDGKHLTTSWNKWVSTIAQDNAPGARPGVAYVLRHGGEQERALDKKRQVQDRVAMDKFRKELLTALRKIPAPPVKKGKRNPPRNLHDPVNRALYAAMCEIGSTAGTDVSPLKVQHMVGSRPLMGQRKHGPWDVSVYGHAHENRGVVVFHLPERGRLLALEVEHTPAEGAGFGEAADSRVRTASNPKGGVFGSAWIEGLRRGKMLRDPRGNLLIPMRGDPDPMQRDVVDPATGQCISVFSYQERGWSVTNVDIVPALEKLAKSLKR